MRIHALIKKINCDKKAIGIRPKFNLKIGVLN